MEKVLGSPRSRPVLGDVWRWFHNMFGRRTTGVENQCLGQIIDVKSLGKGSNPRLLKTSSNGSKFGGRWKFEGVAKNRLSSLICKELVGDAFRIWKAAKECAIDPAV